MLKCPSIVRATLSTDQNPCKKKKKKKKGFSLWLMSPLLTVCGVKLDSMCAVNALKKKHKTYGVV